MKKKILILIIGVLLVVGCNKNEELKEKEQQQPEVIQQEVKTVDVKIGSTSIVTPILMDKLIQTGLVSYSENNKVEKDKCNVGDTIFSDDGNKNIKIDYCNYTDSDNTVRFSTVIKMTIDSDILSINGIIVGKTTYEEVLTCLGKDSEYRNNSFIEEKKNGEVKLYYSLNDSDNNNTIRLEIFFNDSGSVSKMVYAYHK